MADDAVHDGVNAEERTYRSFLDCVLTAAGNPELPSGYDTWGYKITQPDLRTYLGRNGARFRWPWPGSTVTDDATVFDGNPWLNGGNGGFAVALSLTGPARSGYGHATILLISYREADVAGENSHQRRVSHCLVHDIIAGTDAYRAAAGADLSGADLWGADLRNADLSGTDLRNADLRGSKLMCATLWDADLRGARLADADLGGADLRGATLSPGTMSASQLVEFIGDVTG
jgi:hypothetical protein